MKYGKLKKQAASVSEALVSWVFCCDDVKVEGCDSHAG